MNAANRLAIKRFLKSYRVAMKSMFSPPVVALELTSRCNANCSMCWRKEVKRAHTDMDFDVFQKIVCDAGESGVRKYQLSFFGESTLYKELPEAIKFIKTSFPDAWITVNTNAADLDRELGERIVDSGLDQISISIDGNNAREYEEIRRGLKYDVLEANVKALRQLIDDKGAATEVTIRGLNLITHPLDASRFQEKWSAYADKVISRDEHDLIAERPEPLLHRLSPCPKVFSQSIVMVNGDLGLCAYDWHGQVVVGNATRKNIASLRRNFRLLGYQLLHLLGLKRILPLCKTCHYQMYYY